MIKEIKSEVGADKENKSIKPMSCVAELARQVGAGDYEISEEDKKINPAIGRALDIGITNISIKTEQTGALRIRTNNVGYGAKADLVIYQHNRRKDTFQAGAGGGMPGETYHDFRWLAPHKQGEEKIYSNVELTNVLIDTLTALIAVHYIKEQQTKRSESQR